MPDIVHRAGNWLLFVLVLGFVGTGLELVLIEHYEDWKQWIPLVLFGLGLLTTAIHTFSTSRIVALVHATTMVGFGAAGLAGLYLHYRGNVEFELERTPELGGLALFRAAMEGATPALAPGVMIQFGLLGLLFSILVRARRNSPVGPSSHP